MTFNVGIKAFLIVFLALTSACAIDDDSQSGDAPPPRDATTESPESEEETDDDTSAEDEVAGDPVTKRVKVIDTAFVPLDVRVTAGSAIVWKQSGRQAHSVSASDESFESSPECSPIRVDDCLDEGDAFRNVFDEPGTYDYYCKVHGSPEGGGMAGTVTVEG